VSALDTKKDDVRALRTASLCMVLVPLCLKMLLFEGFTEQSIGANADGEEN
jgi:hypothetical protein